MRELALRESLVLGVALWSMEFVMWWTGVPGHGARFILLFSGAILAVLACSTEKGAARALDQLMVRARGAFAQTPAFAPILALSAAALGIWAVIYQAMYDGFRLFAFDAGIYSNLALNVATGNGFHSALLGHNHLGEHFSPIVAIFAPAYLLRPDVRWLLAAQAASYCAVPCALYLLTGCYTPDRVKRGAVAGALSVAWFAYGPMLAAMEYPFHPSSLAAPWIILAFFFLERRRTGVAFAFASFLLLFKENVTLVWVGFGLYVWLQQNRPKLGAVWVVAGVLISGLLVVGVIPSFAENGYEKLDRIGLLADPGGKLTYVLQLLLPLGFLPLLAWRRGVVALPAVAQNLIVSYAPMYSVGHHYDDLSSPLLFATLPGVLLQEMPAWLSGRALPTRVSLAILLAGLPLLFAPKSPLRWYWTSAHATEIEVLHAELTRLPEHAHHFRVQPDLAPHLASPSVGLLHPGPRSCEAVRLTRDTVVAVSALTPLGAQPNVQDCVDALDRRSDLVREPGFAALSVYRSVAKAP